MPRYFFDHYARDETTIDDEGVELVDTGAAKRLALESVGQLILDAAPQASSAQVKVEVRDVDGVVLSASAGVTLVEKR